MKFIVRNFPKFSKFLDQTKASIRSLNFSHNFLKIEKISPKPSSIDVKIDLEEKRKAMRKTSSR